MRFLVGTYDIDHVPRRRAPAAPPSLDRPACVPAAAAHDRLCNVHAGHASPTVDAVFLGQLKNVPSYFACTTDKIISEKKGLYDVFIDGSDIECNDKAVRALIRVWRCTACV